jgi:hypothetical protein
VSSINSPNRVGASKKIKRKISLFIFLFFPPGHELLSGKNGRQAGEGRRREMVIYCVISAGGCLGGPQRKWCPVLLKWPASKDGSVLAVRKRPAICSSMLAVAKTNH